MRVTKKAVEAGSICTQCGICCTGALFDRAKILDGERDRLTHIGFPYAVDEREDGGSQAYFGFPCQMLSGTCCTIYEDRPTKCAEFRCELLKSYESGAIAREEALNIIVTAKSLLARLAATMPPDWTFPQARHCWRMRLAKASPEDADETPEFMMQMSLTNIFLDRYFYSEKKRQLERGNTK